MKAIKGRNPELISQADMDKIKGWRTSHRDNPGGGRSTHLMASSDNLVFPTLFQEDDGSWKEYEKDEWREALERAIREGTVHEAANPQAANLIAEGAWKGLHTEGGLMDVLSEWGRNR
jgi:hypothetical protein